MVQVLKEKSKDLIESNLKMLLLKIRITSVKLSLVLWLNCCLDLIIDVIIVQHKQYQTEGECETVAFFCFFVFVSWS